MDHGIVTKTPDSLKKGDAYIHVVYDIARTGMLEQYYTLYRQTTSAVVGVMRKQSYCFVQNLSHDKSKAIKKAKSITKHHSFVIYETPKKEHETLEAFGLAWKKGKKAYYAKPSAAFWDLWKKEKETIKQAGFWVSKGEKGFMVFFKAV
jgi:hypothetical protein